jgi:hypothetical protein
MNSVTPRVFNVHLLFIAFLYNYLQQLYTLVFRIIYDYKEKRKNITNI